MLSIARVRDAPDRVHEQHLTERRSAPSPAGEIDRRRHVHERQRHELGEPARLELQVHASAAGGGRRARAFDRTEHDRHVRLEPDRVRGAVRVEPLVGVDLVGADDRPHLVVEDLGRGARQRGEAGVLREGEVLGEVHVEPFRAFGDLERGEAVHVDARRRLLHEADDVEVVVAVEVGVDPALETHLGRAARRRLRPRGAASPRCRGGTARRAGSATAGPSRTRRTCT